MFAPLGKPPAATLNDLPPSGTIAESPRRHRLPLHAVKSERGTVAGFGFAH
jgi:hypothetical protein